MKRAESLKKNNSLKILGGGKAKFIIGIIAISAMLPGCAKQIAMPFGSSESHNMFYQDAKTELEAAGFQDISLKEDSTVDRDQDEKVKTISVDGNSHWNKGEKKKKEAAVEIIYYVLQEYETEMSIETSGGDGVPEFTVSTNLPDGAKLVFSLLDENGDYTAQQTQTVKEGKASAIFKDHERQLAAGEYTLTVVMNPKDQQRKIRNEIGTKGDCLVGECVKTDSNGNNYASIETTYESFYNQKSKENGSSYAEVVQNINNALTAGFGENYTISEDATGITVNAWQDGVAMCATLAKDGDSAAVKQWDSLKESAMTMQESLQSLLINNGYADRVIVINILNDVKKENTILTVTYGSVVYDAVSGTNLLGK